MQRMTDPLWIFFSIYLSYSSDKYLAWSFSHSYFMIFFFIFISIVLSIFRLSLLSFNLIFSPPLHHAIIPSPQQLLCLLFFSRFKFSHFPATPPMPPPPPSSSVLSSISLFHFKLFLPFCSLLSTHFWQDVCLLSLFISVDFFTSASARSNFILLPPASQLKLPPLKQCIWFSIPASWHIT